MKKSKKTDFRAYLAEQMQDEAFVAEYEALEPEYEIIRQVIHARAEADLTQKELAERIGTRQSNISRLEAGSSNPSLLFLKKVAEGLGKKLHIEFQ